MILNVVEGRKVETQWSDAYTVGIVLASKGYPGRYETGHPIRGLDRVEGLVYHMGTKFDGKEYLTNGGRVLIVVGRGRLFAKPKRRLWRTARRSSAITSTTVGTSASGPFRTKRYGCFEGRIRCAKCD